MDNNVENHDAKFVSAALFVLNDTSTFPKTFAIFQAFFQQCHVFGWFVSRITQKLRNRFSLNLDG